MSNEAPWDRLPHDPAGFFELAGDFDLKALKRSYGKLIRQFKPETHPQEFQRIRQAYETLESQLRYGVAQRLVSDRNQAWTELLQAAPVSSSQSAAASTTSNRTSKNHFHTAPTQPHVVYKLLKAQSDRRPQDYWLLAALADLTEPDDPMMFLKWLLTGLQQHPEDPGLQQLCMHYLNQVLATELAVKVLPAMAKSLPEHTFFRITENYWLRLLRDQPIEQTVKLFSQCDKLLKHGQVGPRLAFLIRFLRAAMWYAQESWLKEQMEFLSQHGAQMPPMLARELDFLSLINEYRMKLPAAMPATEQKVVHMIRDYCTLSWREGMASVSRCFDELSRDVTGLMESFQVKPVERYHLMLQICHAIVGDFSDQMGQPAFTSSEKVVARHAEAAVVDMTESGEAVFERLGWKRWRMMVIPYVALVAFAIVCGNWFIPQQFSFISIVTAIVLVQIVYFAWLKPFVLAKRWQVKIEELLMVEYGKAWRQRLLRYVQSCHAPSAVIVEQLGLAGRNLNSGSMVNLIHSLAYNDAAIYLLTFSQNLVR